MDCSGALAELEIRLVTKREQLDSYSGRVIDICTSNGVLKEKEPTQNML